MKNLNKIVNASLRSWAGIWNSLKQLHVYRQQLLEASPSFQAANAVPEPQKM